MDSQILSTLAELPAPRRAQRERMLVFDACHGGVILRATVFVETAAAIGAMFGAFDFGDWLGRLAILTAGVFPATVAWLLVACSLKRVLARLPRGLQYAFGTTLGAFAGLYACWLLDFMGQVAFPPWVASAFAGALLAAVLVAALVLRARGRKPAATAARLAELQSRIRPHFLFNTLNSAIALVRAEPARAEALLEDLSDLFRGALAEQGESVTLADEIALARRYLAIEQVRFGDRLRVEWSLDPLADGALLPPLLLQPLVENAVKHGVEPSPDGAQLRISTRRRGDRVLVKVTNTVPAGDGERGAGVALDNVRNRLRLLHDVEASFQTALKDGVYQVRMEIPG